MATHYHSTSRGAVEIASMRYEHAKNAHAKLTRERGDPDVIEALARRVAEVEATFTDQDHGAGAPESPTSLRGGR